MPSLPVPKLMYIGATQRWAPGVLYDHNARVLNFVLVGLNDLKYRLKAKSRKKYTVTLNHIGGVYDPRNF